MLRVVDAALRVEYQERGETSNAFVLVPALLFVLDIAIFLMVSLSTQRITLNAHDRPEGFGYGGRSSDF